MTQSGVPAPQPAVTCGIENGFPAALVSEVAEHESWRKEIYRPLSYIHKWWARRLGSVFRAMIIAGCVDGHENVTDLLWSPVAFPEKVVYDPFMGSGITIHEAVKLGCRVIGRDINPVAYTLVHTALEPYDRNAVIAAYEQIEQAVAPQIRELYQCMLPDGSRTDALYYFWVKIIPCPRCERSIELFKSRVFAKHAYPKENPDSQALCPACNAVNIVHYAIASATCGKCGTSYNPQQGVFTDARVNCPHCQVSFKLIQAVRKRSTPLDHRMYAKLVVSSDGEKVFLPIDDADIALYQEAERRLPDLWHHIPQEVIEPGKNTNQVLNYNYRSWDQMFNARQLAALALLGSAISAIPERPVRALLACLFSGMLEFNNMFASFKGTGTGAVRHMFAHHILKPELTPLEANPWRTKESSGSFSNLFENRILRALDYKERPFELRLTTRNGKPANEKVYGLSRPINTFPARDFATFTRGRQVYLAVGDSAQTDITSKSVDLVVTDPPFFDNVHYSQLADFFYVWLRRLLSDEPAMALTTTRSRQEVQQTDAPLFAERLGAVFLECHRVLKDTGLLIFTYHHTRTEGWAALHNAIRSAGFIVAKTHPVKAEMAVSVPVQQANVPVNFDLIVVCRKAQFALDQAPGEFVLEHCIEETSASVGNFQQSTIELSTGDVKVILMGCILARLAAIGDCAREIAMLHELEEQIDSLVQQVLQSTDTSSPQTPDESGTK
ncbi:MAG TPA: DNA methyltransferase [Herpetosiphonaceae bacterium]|nr:DNA methyltransferase [Herpetosiphonaceae bacterium]